MTRQLSITKERRRSLSLKVQFPNIIQVKAPFFLSNTRINRFIHSKENWIAKKLAAFDAILPYYPLLENEPRLLLYLGKPLHWHSDDTLKKPVFSHTTLAIPSSFSTAKCKKWLKENAKEIIKDRVYTHAKKMNLTVNTIRLKSAKTLWGSCSSKGNLNFNWRLLFCPLEVIDYVVIHELSHLTHMNHSPAFWKLVLTYCPHAKTHTQWLKKHSGLLYLN